MMMFGHFKLMLKLPFGVGVEAAACLTYNNDDNENTHSIVNLSKHPTLHMPIFGLIYYIFGPDIK